MAILKTIYYPFKSRIYLFIAFFIIALPFFTICAKNSNIFNAYNINVDKGKISFFKLGHGKNYIVLLHGLFAEKEQWENIVNKLIDNHPNFLKKYTIIIPDLPGFGKSNTYPFSAYLLTNTAPHQLSQIKILNDFLNKLHIKKKVNIAGNSMGGEIAALYTTKYPNKVKTLAFIGSPAGIVDFSPIFFREGFKQGFNPFIPTTLPQFTIELSLLTPNYKNIMPSKAVINHLILPSYKKNYKKLTAIFNVINLPENRNGLNRRLPIQQACLIMWGNQDHIFGSSRHGIKLLHNLDQAKYSKLFIIKGGGHLVLLGNDKVVNQLVSHYSKFLKKFN